MAALCITIHTSNFSIYIELLLFCLCKNVKASQLEHLSNRVMWPHVLCCVCYKSPVQSYHFLLIVVYFKELRGSNSPLHC